MKTWLTHLDVERGEQLTCERADGHARSGLAGTGALEDVAHVRAVVLQRPCQIGVPGTWPRYRGATRTRGVSRRVRTDVHRLLPVLPVAIADEHRDRAAERDTLADAAKDLRRVGLDLHAPAAAIAQLSAPQVVCEQVLIDRQARWQSVDRCQEGLSV